MRQSRYGLIALMCLLGSPQAFAQVAGYRVGASGLDTRAIPCEANDGEWLCRPSGDLYLRIRRDTLVSIDTSWVAEDLVIVTAPDVWRRARATFEARFGPPDSVRTIDTARLARAYADAVVAYWAKPEWCAALTIKTAPREHFTVFDLEIERRGTWAGPCSGRP